MLGGIEWDNRNFGFHIRFFRFTHIVHSYFGNKKSDVQKEHRSKHEKRPNLGRFSWKICIYGGSIHPVEKVGVTNHPGANGIELEWRWYVNPVKKVMKKARFLRKRAFS